MITHMIMIKWKAPLTAAQLDTVNSGFAALKSGIPLIKSMRFGPDLKLGSENFHYAMVAEFESTDDFLGYVGHPRHLEFVSVLVEFAAEAVRVQFAS